VTSLHTGPIVHRPWGQNPRGASDGHPQAVDDPDVSGKSGELIGETFAATMMHLDEGASSGARIAVTSVVLIGVTGSLQVAAGGESFDVGTRDVLTIPQGMSYTAVNRGPDVAVCASVRSTEDEPADVEPLSGAHLLAWRTYRRSFRSGIMPRAEIFGHHRLSGSHTPLRTLLGHAVRVPPSQASPWHEVPRDLLFVQLKGEIDFASAGSVTSLHPGDLLYVHANTPYCYANYGFGDALFFDIGGRILTPGATSTYYEDDPGWPVRPGSPSYKIVSDDPAFRAIYGS
jgi:mannose-6-phosphate isomerase-like protein (cupin superfamily)